MRAVFALLVLPPGITSAAPALANTAADETAVRTVFDAFCQDWNTPGFPGLEKLLVPDADFVVVTGKSITGGPGYMFSNLPSLPKPK